MKKFIVWFALLTTLQFTKADTLAEWTFETSHPVGPRSAGVWFTNVTAEIGSGTASGFHSGNASYSPYVGNGSAYSFGASNTWAVGDFFQFAVSTTGYQNIQISYDQVGNSTGPGTFFLAYSTDGSIFTKFGSDYAVSAGKWSSTISTNANSFSFNLNSITAINGQSIVYFRVVDDSTIAIGGGTVTGLEDDRIDNFLVSAQPVPEPSVMALAVLGAFGAFVLKRKSLKS
jgi:hypothetical protein